MATARPPKNNLNDRESTAELRASVLDAAISIGFRNSVMAKWMFDPIQESEDGDEVSNLKELYVSCMLVGMDAISFFSRVALNILTKYPLTALTKSWFDLAIIVGVDCVSLYHGRFINGSIPLSLPRALWCTSPGPETWQDT